MTILDAPGLRDDFYLNLLDWSKTNILAVALAADIYLWKESDRAVTLLTSLKDAQDPKDYENHWSCLSWMEDVVSLLWRFVLM